MDAATLLASLDQRPLFSARLPALDESWLRNLGGDVVQHAAPGGALTVVWVAGSAPPAISDAADARLVVVDAGGRGGGDAPAGAGLVRVPGGTCLAAARNAGASIATTPFVTFAAHGELDVRAVLAWVTNQRAVAVTLVREAGVDKALPANWADTAWSTAALREIGGFDPNRCGHEALVLAHRLLETGGRAASDFAVVTVAAAPLASAAAMDPECPSPACQLPAETREWCLERDFPLLPQTRASLTPEARPTGVLAGAATYRTVAIKELAAQRRAAWAVPSPTPEPPRVSVVVTSYNMAASLGRAVRSVTAQTLAGVELIVVDDASTDPESIAAVRSTADVAHVIVRERNGGAAAARNTGIAASRAPLVVCLDGDDQLTAEYLEDAWHVFELLPQTAIVASHVKYVGERSDRWRVRDHATVVNALAESPCGISAVFKRSLWEELGGFDEQLRGYEDWDFWIRALAIAGELRAIPRAHFRYSVSASSKVNTSNANADAIVGYLTSKHAALYAQHFAEVFAIKHRHVLYARKRALAASAALAAALADAEAPLPVPASEERRRLFTKSRR